jgi:hypothetical protein
VYQFSAMEPVAEIIGSHATARSSSRSDRGGLIQPVIRAGVVLPGRLVNLIRLDEAAGRYRRP